MSFRLMVVSVLCIGFVYLVWSLVAPLKGRLRRLLGLLILGGIFGIMISGPLLLWRHGATDPEWLGPALQWLSYALLGFMSFVFVVAFVRDTLALFFRGRLRTQKATAVILALAAVLSVAGMVEAYFGVHVHTIELPIAGLPKAYEGFRISQLSDLHVGATMRRGFVERAVKLVESTKSDLIVFTGDAGDGDPALLVDDLEPLRRLSAPYGKYFVPGNHEYYSGVERWVSKFAELGFEPLMNQHRVLTKDGQKMVLAGVTDGHRSFVHGAGPDPKAAIAGAPVGTVSGTVPKLLLSHFPYIAKQAEPLGYNAVIAGHTHGGQFLPWTLIAALVHQYPNGLSWQGKTAVVVSRGTGSWGPPVRMGSRPEVILLVLKGR